VSRNYDITEQLTHTNKEVLGTASLEGKGVRAILEKPQFVAPPKYLWFLYFLLKNGSFRKMFDRAPP
jgi:hypothetical protein